MTSFVFTGVDVVCLLVAWPTRSSRNEKFKKVTKAPSTTTTCHLTTALQSISINEWLGLGCKNYLVRLRH